MPFAKDLLRREEFTTLDYTIWGIMIIGVVARLTATHQNIVNIGDVLTYASLIHGIKRGLYISRILS